MKGSNRRLAPLRTVTAGVAFLLLAAACATASSSGTPPPAATAASSPQPPPFIATRVASVAGTTRTILTDLGGMTLYYETTDVGGKITCTGPCAVIWPPYIAPGGLTALPAVFAIPGKFTTAPNPEGKNQVAYNGWPLFAFSKDKAPGDITGEGVAGRWHAASTDLQPTA